MTVSDMREEALRDNMFDGSHPDVFIGDADQAVEPASLIIFGITGDLSRKKLVPALYDLAYTGSLPPDFHLVGFARSGGNLVPLLRESVMQYCRTPFDEQVWSRLVECFHFIQGSFTDSDAFRLLAERLKMLDASCGKAGNYVFYLSIAPSNFAIVCEQLELVGLNRSQTGWRRVVVEKPFGHDLPSSRVVGAAVGRAFPQGAIYRIDHYLGKETVQNILALRFANGMFEPLWNAHHIDHVQITMAETVGVAGRGGYYDGVGAARDVIQNHLLQLLALVAMDEPVTFDAHGISSEKAKILSAVELLGPFSETSARGQYGPGIIDGSAAIGLRSEEGFPAGSRTETFAALTATIATRRWAGVPFYIRTGKRLAQRCTEIAVTFKPAYRSWGTEDGSSTSNILVFRVQPNDGIELHIGAKKPGGGMHVAPISLDVEFKTVFDSAPDAYERLIHNVFRGDAALFPRSEEVEQSWRIVDPLLRAWAEEGLPELYTSGSDGPSSASAMLASQGREWRPLRGR